MYNVRLEPVKNKHGDVVLFDIFLNGEWVGSKRTQEQAAMRIDYLTR